MLAALLGVTAGGCGVVPVGRLLGASTRALVMVDFLAMPVLAPWLSARPRTMTYALLPLAVVLAATVLRWQVGLSFSGRPGSSCSPRCG